MKMGKAITLGRLFGFEFRLHFSWFFIFLLVTVSLVRPHYGDWSYWAVAIAGSLLLFASVLGHELAHSVVGRSVGIPISSITLFIFGGVAQMTREAPDPKAELKMAAAGPLCSLVISALFWLLLWAGRARQPIDDMLFWLAMTNLSLAIFNLVPGFPLDGGRIFRAILWRLMRNYKRASLIAVRVGQGIGYLLVLSGIVAVILKPFGMTWFDGLWLSFIGWFLANAATESYRQILVQEVLAQNEHYQPC